MAKAQKAKEGSGSGLNKKPKVKYKNAFKKSGNCGCDNPGSGMQTA